MLKKRDASGELIKKVLTYIDTNISIDMLIYSHSSNSFKAQSLAIENNKEDELDMILEEFSTNQLALREIRSKLKNKKGHEFFGEIFRLAAEKRIRAIELSYYFLCQFENADFKALEGLSLKVRFYKLLTDISDYQITKDFPIIKREDLSPFLTWVTENLDGVSIAEIIKSLQSLKGFVREQLLKTDKASLNNLERQLYNSIRVAS